MTAYQRSNSAVARLVRAAGDLLARRAGGRLCIVNYHRVLTAGDPLMPSDPDLATFRAHMKLLADCFNVLPLHQAMAALAAGSLPPRAVCITFDDGYRSVHELALPVLREFGLPAAVFVTTGCIGSGTMWNDRIIDAVRRLPERDADLGSLGLGRRDLGSAGERSRVTKALTDKAKYLPSDHRLELVEAIEALAGAAAAPELMLTADAIRALAGEGIEIGAHTVSHPILSSLNDADAAHEIGGSKRFLEELTGKPVRYFAYPNGKVGVDYDARHVEMVRLAGFEAAFTTALGAATAAHDRYQVPRSRPWDNSVPMYALRLLRWLGAAAGSPARSRGAGQDDY